MGKITKRVVEAAEGRANDYVIWDDELPGVRAARIRLRQAQLRHPVPRRRSPISPRSDPVPSGGYKVDISRGILSFAYRRRPDITMSDMTSIERRLLTTVSELDIGIEHSIIWVPQHFIGR